MGMPPHARPTMHGISAYSPCVSPRRSLLAGLMVVALAAASSPAVAGPALAMTPKMVTPGWSPSDPPRNRAAFDMQMSAVLYAVSCRTESATGWASSMVDDTSYDWRSMLVTTSTVSTACIDTRDELVVRQGTETFPAYSWTTGSSSGLGSIAVIPYVTGAYWDESPMPRSGQWVAIGGRAPDGALLPILERRVVAVGESTFSINESVGSDYLGAPVVDNLMRVLGTLTEAGKTVTGSPVYCGVLFECEEPNQAWRDITAPSVPRSVKASAGKGRVTVTWKPALSDGGDGANYRYSVNGGPWIDASKFSITVKARKGVSVTVSVQSFNAAGWGPTVTRTARAS